MVTSLITLKGAYVYIWSNKNNNNAPNASAPRTIPPPSTFNPTYPATPVAPTPALPPAQPLEPYGTRNIQSQQSTNNRGYVYTNPQHGDTHGLAHSFSQLSTTGHGAYSQSFAAPPRTSSISQDYGPASAPAIALDPIPTFGHEGRPSDSRLCSGMAVSRHGSSLDAQTSTRSYLNHDTTAASAKASGNKSSRLSGESSKGRLDPSEETSQCSMPERIRNDGKDTQVEQVFIKLHTEDAGSNRDNSSVGFSTVLYEELAYSQLRRFVVVKARPKEYYCLCVPILTYRGKGATKKSVDKSAHAIIYTGSSAPERLPEEQGMNKNPLRVIPVRADEKLDPLSRVNLGKTYPVEWNTKVKEIGRIEKPSLVKLLTYWKLLMNG
ncbi:MAG: hypothetical protein Q9226_007219 [Calogaya cf. arnoldii]